MNVSAQDDSSSLLPIGSRQTQEFPGTGSVGQLDVIVTTLATEISADAPRPLLLKVDVQGLEFEVLRGAGDALDLVDEILMECSFVELYEGQALADEVVAFLLGRGLRLTSVHGVSYSRDGTAVQADFFFRRRRQ